MYDWMAGSWFASMNGDEPKTETGKEALGGYTDGRCGEGGQGELHRFQTHPRMPVGPSISGPLERSLNFLAPRGLRYMTRLLYFFQHLPTGPVQNILFI